MLSQKENSLRIINFDNPEYIRIEIPAHHIWYTGAGHEGYNGGGHHLPAGSTWTDIWGTEWYKELPDVMGFPRFNPLEKPENLKNYAWPDPDDERICAKIYETREKYDGSDVFIGGSHRDTLWEKSYMIVGMENMMEYLYTEPQYAKEILHNIMDFQMGIAKHYIKSGVEIVFMGDDLGTQKSLLIGKEKLYEFFVPEYKRLFDFYKQHGVLISFHSCGHVEPIIDMFMELGVNVLNPVQVTANDIVKIRAATEGKMAINGAVSTAILMNGSVSDVEAAVKNTMKVMGKNGGYFCSPDQYMPFPKENIDAFYETVNKYGKYPLDFD